ncbi:MAG: hypothetical protein K2M97_08290 [Muribaculaceae bacterium]|nr:hypothetical protein [Muribaculaceae bacterium]
MKNNLIKCIFALSALTAIFGCDDEPEVKNPMFTNGRGWTTEYYSVEENGDICVRRIILHTIVGDTVVSGKKCKLRRTVTIKNNYYGDNYLQSDTLPESYDAYFEQFGRVYHVNFGEKPAKIMDFTLNAGDRIKWGTYHKNGYGYMRVLSKDYIEVAGRKYRRLIIGDESGNEITRWVEGIGESRPIGGLIYGNPQPLWDYKERNTNFCKGDEIIFTYEDFFE